MNDNEDLRAPLTIHLTGPAVSRHRLPFDQLTLFAEQLQVAVHRVGRILSGEAVSLSPGPVPKEVREACRLELVATRPGSFELVCDLPIAEHSQLPLFEASDEQPDLGERSLEALVRGIGLVGAGEKELPPGFDKGVLMALRESGKLFTLGVEGIEFTLASKKSPPVQSRFTPAVQKRIVDRIQEPVPNKTTIEGRLLMGDFRGFACRIHPNVGKPIRCTFAEELKESVLAAMTRFVRLVGETHEINDEIKSFNIEDIEIIDAEQFAGGQDFHPFFDSQIDLDVLAAEQGVPSKVRFDELIGTFWPEDESADDFINAVQSWRREDLPNAS